jgi:hypothetical protein
MRPMHIVKAAPDSRTKAPSSEFDLWNKAARSSMD